MGICIITVSLLLSEPAFNGSSPGCGGGGCHSFQDGAVSVTILDNLQVEVTVSGTGSKVGGELVDENGTVVDVIENTSTNPFILSAPFEGTYLINVGYKNPSKRWDSSLVVFSVSDVNDGDNSPVEFILKQNYPNPFNPSTRISYSIPEAGLVTLRVYDVLGNEVDQLVYENKEVGEYSVSFDASSASGGLSNGIYFYRLKVNNHVSIKKMVLLK
ncbi:MAG: T9SS type A sorting domain-containing protein [Ignavibacterium sp.]|nr:MAG: T9SS type A sorting domain-containing protein [Ignavibacterium sp.]